MRLFLPADAPPWLKAFANSVDDKLRNLLTAPLRLLGLATADLPDAAAYRQGLVYDLTTGQIAYSTGATWNQLFGSGNAALNAVSSLTPAADKYVYFISPSAAALGTITAFGRSLVDDADAAAVRATLGLVIGTHVQAHDALLASIAGLAFGADNYLYGTGTDTAATGTIT